jgi:predicted O-linked N-acetylglucosamine transferase (SPINDLY family)
MQSALFRLLKQFGGKRSIDAQCSVADMLLAAETSARQGDTTRALELYAKAIEMRPELAEAHYKRGNLLRVGNRLDEALASYDRAIAIQPGYANAFCNRGVVLERLGRLVDALQSYTRGIELNPNDSLAHYNRGSVLKSLGRRDEALASYNEAIRIQPDHAESYCNRGLMLAELGEWDAALMSYDLALTMQPSLAQAHFNRAALLRERRQLTEALASYDRAIEADPTYADAYCNRGLVLMESRKFQEALASFAEAIQLRADFAEAYCNRGLVFAELKQADRAIHEFSTALALRPDYAEAYHGRGTTLLNQKDFTGAIADYASTVAIKPDFRFVFGMLRHVKMTVCDWSDLDSDLSRIADGIEADATISPPFPLLALTDAPPLHLKAARIWVREECLELLSLPPLDRHPPADKIRIGYFSADFRDHAVAVLMAGLFESHDRSMFEVTAFAFGPDIRDAMRERLERAFDRFVDVRQKSDQEVAVLARSLRIDIAIDLGGYTGHSRPKIFANRAAPIQISYIGYLGTMGAPYMDYLIADPTVVPADERQNYSEKLIYLPSYQVNDSRRRIVQRSFSREELGIPAVGFVFCCFNSNYKIMPATFSLWMRILQRVEGSVLFLYADNPRASQNLQHEAQRCGIDSRRIIFGARLGTQDYLARLCNMDLFLDTLPYNAGATASDALWAGLPVLTCAGRAFAGRVAASLLNAVDLPELIASTPQQYEELAVRLASNPDELASIREKLARNRQTTLLFDTASFTRNLESAYVTIHGRNQKGLAPEHVFAAPEHS